MKSTRAFKVEGTRLVRAIVRDRGVAEVAKKTKMSEKAVQHWHGDRRRPGADARVALMKHYGIPLEAWELPAEKPAPAPSSSTNGAANGAPPAAEWIPGESARDKALRQLRRLEDRLARAEHANLSTREYSDLERTYSVATSRFAKLTGETDVTTAAIMRSRPWVELMKAIEAALEPHPAAAIAMARVLEALAS